MDNLPATLESYLKHHGLPSNTESFLRYVDGQMLPLLERCALPLCGYKDGTVCVFGTGTLLRIGIKSFLVTASHVVTQASHAQIGLGITDWAPEAKLISLHGSVHGMEELDIAVWDLPEDVIKSLPNRVFLSIDQTVKGVATDNTSTFLIHGYPEEYGKFEITSPSHGKGTVLPITEFTGPFTGSTDNLEGYDSSSHLLLDTHKGEGEAIRNEHILLPSRRHGMSGCTIWQVYTEGFNASQWTCEIPRIAAVQTGVYYKGNITKATKWHFVYSLFWHKYPELRDLLSSE